MSALGFPVSTEQDVEGVLNTMRREDVLRLVDYEAWAEPDDTQTMQRMIAAWQANSRGGAMVLPSNRETVLSAPCPITVGQGQALVLTGEHGMDARIRVAASFTGTCSPSRSAHPPARPKVPRCAWRAGLRFDVGGGG